MRYIKSILAIINFLLCFNMKAQVRLDSISSVSLSCSMNINACEGDTLTLVPQNQSNYKNYKWYAQTVNPENQINGVNAATFNVISNNFGIDYPNIRLISNGGIYILTCEYSIDSACVTINDTFRVNFSKRPIVQINSESGNSVCSGSNVILSAKFLNNPGNCTFQWQKTSPNGDWGDIPGANTNLIVVTPLNNVTRYRTRIICDDNACCN